MKIGWFKRKPASPPPPETRVIVRRGCGADQGIEIVLVRNGTQESVEVDGDGDVFYYPPNNGPVAVAGDLGKPLLEWLQEQTE